MTRSWRLDGISMTLFVVNFSDSDSGHATWCHCPARNGNDLAATSPCYLLLYVVEIFSF